MGSGRKRAFAGTIRTARYPQGLNVLRDLVNQRGDDQVLVIDGVEGKCTRLVELGKLTPAARP